jgi:hypothetical protein
MNSGAIILNPPTWNLSFVCYFLSYIPAKPQINSPNITGNFHKDVYIISNKVFYQQITFVAQKVLSINQISAFVV